MRLHWRVGFCIGFFTVQTASATLIPEMAQGLEAFRNKKWKLAGEQFLVVLDQDPRHREAQTYLNLTAKELLVRQRDQTQQARKQYLSAAVEALDAQQKNPHALEKALATTLHAEENARQATWDAACDEAEVDMDLGRLFPAYDRILAVLEENQRHLRGQQILSVLQSRNQFLLDQAAELNSAERFALEGFQRYAAGDMTGAVTAWNKAHTLQPEQIKPWHYALYWKKAEDRAEELRQRATLQELFQGGVQLFSAARYLKALQTFRRIAMIDPEYPQLGGYIARAEAAVEKERALRLGEQRQKEVEQLFEKAVGAMQNERYREAQRFFQQVLERDATHVQAHYYLSIAEAELFRRHDPKLAHQHYETGLIAYASGRLEEAVREWEITLRMDAGHDRAQRALDKVRKELALDHAALP